MYMDLSTGTSRSSDRRLADFELDVGRYELRRSGRRVKLEKKCMELLILLVQRRDQLVLREEIAAQLWSSDPVIDIERNINNIIRKIRTALADNPRKPHFLGTVVGKGYRFSGPIRYISGPYSTGRAQPTFAHQGHHQQTRGSSLAVLPLRLVRDAKDSKGLSIGITDALVSRLANLEGIHVLPTSAVLNLPPHAPLSENASRLGVRFLVHGTLDTSRLEVRLSVEVDDCESKDRLVNRTVVLDPANPFEEVEEIAREIARALRRPLRDFTPQMRARYSRDPMAYAEFIQGYRRSSSGDPQLLQEASHHLTNAVTRDPDFALAHAVLAYVCAARHFEFDPKRSWLDKAEFHCARALELNPDLAEGHVTRAFLLWGPSKNFQHLEAIAELKRALGLQKNLPHAYNRLGTIFAHVGLLDHARTMYERGIPFDPQKEISHSVAQVHLWSGRYKLAEEEISKWREENPANKYAIYFAPQPALLSGNWEKAQTLLDEAARLMPEEPLITSMQGVMLALRHKSEPALRCMNRACANPKSFGHAHHTYYQIACILSLLGRPDSAFEWLERSIDTGFACWPFFLKDPCLKNLRSNTQFELLISSLQAKYPDELGIV